MDRELLESRMNYLKITEEAIAHFERAKEQANYNKNVAIATSQEGARKLYEEQEKLAQEQIGFYKSVKDKIVSELINIPEYKNYLQNIGAESKQETDIQMR